MSSCPHPVVGWTEAPPCAASMVAPGSRSPGGVHAHRPHSSASIVIRYVSDLSSAAHRTLLRKHG
eukprot:315690-Ditylum_brightwellii.AAC.1